MSHPHYVDSKESVSRIIININNIHKHLGNETKLYLKIIETTFITTTNK